MTRKVGSYNCGVSFGLQAELKPSLRVQRGIESGSADSCIKVAAIGIRLEALREQQALYRQRHGPDVFDCSASSQIGEWVMF